MADGTRSIVAEKAGKGKTLLTVMMLSHYDTVEAPPNILGFHREQGKIRGRGSWDLKGACQMGISLCHTVRPPEGLRLLFAWVPNEESRSKGVQALMNWPGMHDTDIVMGMEIGPNPEREEGEPFTFINSRRGDFKFDGSLFLTKGANHMAENGVTENAITEWAIANTLLLGDAHANTTGLFENIKKTRSRHGSDKLSNAAIERRRGDFYSTPTKVTFGLNDNVIPITNPRDAHSVLEELMTCFQRIKKARDWSTRNIDFLLKPCETHTSYPFELDPDTGLFLPIREAMKKSAMEGTQV